MAYYLPTYIEYYYFQLKVIWTSKSPIFSTTIGLKKNSPYGKFFKHAIYDLIEKAIFKERNSIKSSLLLQQSEELENENQLGYSKLASLFAILLFGLIASILISLLECICKPKELSLERRKKINIDNYINQLSDLTNLLENDLKHEAEQLMKKIKSKK